MIKLIILFLITDCSNSTPNTLNKKIEYRESLKKGKPLNINNYENKKPEKNSFKKVQSDSVLTLDQIIEKIKDKNLEEGELKNFLVKNYIYLNEILKYSLIYDNFIALKFLLKNYSVNDFDLSLALEKYFESDDSNDIYIDYIINYFKFKSSNFFDIFIDKIKTLKNDKTIKIDNLIQKILKVNSSLFEEDIKNLFKASIDKISEETLSILAGKLATNDVKLKIFKELYSDSKNERFFNNFLNFILNKEIIKEILDFILMEPLNQNFKITLSNNNFKKLFEEFNKYYIDEVLRLINEYLKIYLETDYKKAGTIVELLLTERLIKIQDLKFKQLFQNIQNKENNEKLLEFCFILKVPQTNLERSWNEYIKLGLDEDLNFRMFKKFYEKSSEKEIFLSNRISKIIYSYFDLQILNYIFEQNIIFNDKTLVNIFKKIITFFKNEKDLNLLSLKLAETILNKIKDFNAPYNDDKIGEELIIILFINLSSISEEKLYRDETKQFLDKVIKTYSEKQVELRAIYSKNFEKIKQKVQKSNY